MDDFLFYDVEGGVVIADRAGWLPGYYDSRATAIEGAKLYLDENTQAVFCSLQRRVNFVNLENRAITIHDLNTIRS